MSPNDDFRVRMQATKHPAERLWLALMSLRLAIILNEQPPQTIVHKTIRDTVVASVGNEKVV